MKLEHIALNVAEPAQMAAWYVGHLGLRVVRQQAGDAFIAFLVDASGGTVLELYHNPRADRPDFAAMSRYAFHIAFSVDQIEVERERLVAAGAVAEHPVEVRVNGDRLGFVRDPWGVPLQLVERHVPLLDESVC